jgi:choline dehydrogenase-like flavoprotein
MLAEKLAELKPGLQITIVEAGKSLFDFENRMHYRQRYLEYGENPWPDDLIEDQTAKGIISRTMAVGGQALHWGGTTNRFSEEDLGLRSLYGLAVDWPLSYEELERYYCEGEWRQGVSGEPSPLPRTSGRNYPMPAMTLATTCGSSRCGSSRRHPLAHCWDEHTHPLRRVERMPAMQDLRGVSDGRGTRRTLRSNYSPQEDRLQTLIRSSCHDTFLTVVRRRGELAQPAAGMVRLSSWRVRGAAPCCCFTRPRFRTVSATARGWLDVA